MDIPWGSIASGKFLTNVGLITSNGPWGPNVMSAEWTHHISYSPGLIMINVHASDATAENILKSKEFGINIAAENQNVIASIAGGSSGKEVDKVDVLKEFGVEFYNGKKIDVPMLKGAVLNIECRVIKQETMGDHIMFIGEAVEVSVNEDVNPIIYHGGKYWKVGERIQKPEQAILEKISKLVEKHRKTR